MSNKKFLFITKDISANENSDGTSIILHNLLKRLNHFNLEIIYFGVKNIDAENHFNRINVSVYHECILSNQPVFFERIHGYNFIKPFNVFKYRFSNFNLMSDYYSDYYCFLGFESGFLLPYFREQSIEKIIYFEIDSLSMYYTRSVNNSKSFISKIYNKIQLLLINHCESCFYTLSSKIIFVSIIDKNFTLSKYLNSQSNKFFNIKLGTLLPIDLWRHKYISNECNIIFTGNFDYKPNLEAAQFIVDKIVPCFNNEKYTVKFHLVGHCSKNLIALLGVQYNPNVIVAGYVDDLDKYLSKTDIFISPLFIGSGMKNKVLKAMSIGVPIICSSLTVDGIDQMQNGLNCVVCNSGDGVIWKEEISKLIFNPVKMKEYSANTRNIAKLYYDWDVTANEFLDITSYNE